MVPSTHHPPGLDNPAPDWVEDAQSRPSDHLCIGTSEARWGGGTGMHRTSVRGERGGRPVGARKTGVTKEHYSRVVGSRNAFTPSVQPAPAPAFESVSSWSQPMPASASAARTKLMAELSRRIVATRTTRVLVVIDGYTASGKTSFGHELAAAIRDLGRPTLRASFDDFKKPWSDAREKGYDRLSGEGYYRNAPDFESARTLLLEPARPEGSGLVALCAHDPLTGEDRRGVTVNAPADAVLIVDSVFGMRAEYDDLWDYRIWIDVPPELALARGIARDAELEGREDAERVHRDRYHVAEEIYIAEVDPRSRADAVIDNTDFTNPVVLRW